MDNLYEAYLNVYEANDSYLETDMKKRAENNKKALEDMEKTDAHKTMVATVRKKFDEETDLFNYLLEYLVAEGYADTNQAAIAIMSNMSEEWKESIINEAYKDFPTAKVMKKAGELMGSSAGKTDPKSKKKEQRGIKMMDVMMQHSPD